jgi:hypothetical protein
MVSPSALAVFRLTTRSNFILDRDVFRFDAAEDLDNQTRQLPIDRCKARAVANQTILFRHFGPYINRGQTQRRGPLDDDPAIDGEQRRR